MEDCLFCKICEGTIPSSTVYEDKLIKVIMNINPNSNGHLLVIPKEHYTNLLDLDLNVLTHSIEVIKDTIYPTLKEKLNCEGLTLAQNTARGFPGVRAGSAGNNIAARRARISAPYRTCPGIPPF